MMSDAATSATLGELLPPMSDREATLEANRCLYCSDAPCLHACPTHIDIPKFIKRISTQNLLGSAKAILESNLLGATCARVCPVQELCEGACVLGADHRPIQIGRLQRYAMDSVRGVETTAIKIAPTTGKSVAVVGAGPAGLSCAGELTKLGHKVTLYERRKIGGGLSTFGIIQLREPIEIATGEAAFIEKLGVKFEYGVELGRNKTLAELRRDFDAVYIGVGLGLSPDLRIPGEEWIVDGLRLIEQSKMETAKVRIGKNVVVIGAGNTAIDCATIAKRSGADKVTIVYRRTENEMTAYPHEYEFAKNEGIRFEFLVQPTEVISDSTGVTGLRMCKMQLGAADGSGRRAAVALAEQAVEIPADQIIKAIGQVRHPLAALLGLNTKNGFIAVTEKFETSTAGVYAGGDCIRSAGAASTVMAVQDGKLAARAIHDALMGAKA
jgi:glutamate synthase (NADPH/NADH) small chain